jgi:hypothetical protein
MLGLSRPSAHGGADPYWPDLKGVLQSIELLAASAFEHHHEREAMILARTAALLRLAVQDDVDDLVEARRSAVG